MEKLCEKCKREIEFIEIDGESKPKYPDREGKPRCIYHSRNDEKAEEFYESISKIIDERNDAVRSALDDLHEENLPEDERERRGEAIRIQNLISFEGFYFPSDANFRGKKFIPDVDFEHADFGGKAFFGSVAFSGDADFRGATFNEKADFRSATFGNEADFNNTTFSGKADFRGATFGSEADFNNAAFSGGANFGEATFSGETSFYHAIFSEGANFWNATFGGGADFNSAAFKGTAFFFYTTFGGKANFHFATFGGKAFFGSVAFNGEASFSDTDFSRYASFEYAIFSGMADFRSATFKGETVFENAAFSERADFRNAAFSGAAYFSFVTFEKETDFRFSSFGLEVVFDYANFAIRGVFTDCNLSNATFERAELHNSILEGIKYSEKTMKGILLDTFTESTNRIFARKAADYNYLEQRKSELRTLKDRISSPKLYWKYFWKIGLFELWRISSNYGRSFWKWLLCCVIIALYFGFIFWSMISLGDIYINKNADPDIFAPFYYSVVTFTTLGFGDIIPVNGLARLFVTFEVIFGYLMLGALISILANRFARRA
jgi:uncharacterized protein YjbI with pentapeptide repeats